MSPPDMTMVNSMTKPVITPESPNRADRETLNSAGLPMLPARFAPSGRRRLFSFAMARRELAQHLPPAREEAVARIKALMANGAREQEIDDARQILAFLRHSRGPMFQLAILQETSTGKLQPLITPDQSSLERVREISAAIATAINQIPLRTIKRTINMLHRPWLPENAAHQNRALAERFLANTPAENMADPCFAPLQRLVDEAAQAGHITSGGKAKHIDAATTKAREAVARRICNGEIGKITEI